ncbi:MAG: sulfatase [Saprospiraceae bacterium]|nr:sulfatase [Saprospiraceae bacterium]
MSVLHFKLPAVLILSCFFVLGCESSKEESEKAEQPNILFAISDDQSYPYTSILGSRTVHTPRFDAVARKGVLFHNVFCAAPQCSPNRAAILTGKNIWQLEEAGTHASYFPAKFAVFTDVLEKGGYELGYTGKAWGPGNWKDAGRARNPVGPEYNDLQFDEVPAQGISRNNYAANFAAFLDQRDANQPFFFWFGAFEPHRVYEEESGLRSGKSLDDADVPPFLPDVPEIRSDVIDYGVEIEWFDTQLGKMIDRLDQMGELENTIIIITSDNGMAFPAAKANLQEYGIHVPLAICGPGISSGLESEDLVSHIDLAPTILDLAKVPAMEMISGMSFLSILTGQSDRYTAREWIVAGRERHTHARPDNLGYPARAIRTHDYLYIHNLKPDLWPAGDPEIDEVIKRDDGSEEIVTKAGYFDIDASPSKSYLLDHQAEFPAEFQLGFGKRPAEQLYAIDSDPGCLVNLAANSSYEDIRKRLKSSLEEILLSEGDPRITGEGNVFDSYPRMSPMRNFPGFKERGQYNPEFMPQQSKNPSQD